MGLNWARQYPNQPSIPAAPTIDGQIIAAARAAKIARRDWEELEKRAFNSAAKESRKERNPQKRCRVLPKLMEKHINLELARLRSRKRKPHNVTRDLNNAVAATEIRAILKMFPDQSAWVAEAAGEGWPGIDILLSLCHRITNGEK
ncbi:MAG TPA: hypothetical protein VMF67_09805 [Rhizomicrobium sp.]|nr:hypothetical protein [Rhizomicrobium sp.]